MWGRIDTKVPLRTQSSDFAMLCCARLRRRDAKQIGALLGSDGCASALPAVLVIVPCAGYRYSEHLAVSHIRASAPTFVGTETLAGAKPNGADLANIVSTIKRETEKTNPP
jgi:hypothetical protein